jgi:mRNA interferase RelE/StbE
LAWNLEISDGAKKDIKRLDRHVARRITDFLRERLMTLDDPRSTGEALAGPELGKYWKYRVGDYRIIASIKDDVLTIVVVRIAHRKVVYR